MFNTFCQYNQFLVFLLGVLHFFSYYGFGAGCLQVIKASPKNIFLRCFSFSLGVLIISIIVQYLSFFQIMFYKTILSVLEYVLIIIGCIALYTLRSELKKILDEIKSNKYLFISLLIIVGGLLISIAPLSKHDELHYHALTPARLLSDGYMHFYMWPFEGAILPQMFFQISVTPLFAIHVPNAANVSGYMFSVLIFILLYCYTKSMTDKKYAFIASSICLIGMHTYVFHTTLGGHAYGEMSLLLLLLMLLFVKAFINIGRGYRIFILSTLCVAVLSSKLSHLPVIFIITCYIYYTEIFKAENKISDYLCLLLPYILFYLPILLYTFNVSGSPFGPVFANLFNNSVYNVTEIEHVLNRYSSKLPYLNLTITYFIKIICFDYSPVVIVSLLVYIIRGYRYNQILFLFFIIQLMVIYLQLPHDIRFFGGTIYCVSIICLIHFYTQKMLFKKYKCIFVRVSMVILILYSCILCLYGSQFFGISLGIQTKQDFFQKKIAMYSDFIALNKILPKNATILACGIRANGVYFPRDVIYDIRDYENKGSELFILSPDDSINNCETVPFRLGKKRYTNKNANVVIFRTPFNKPLVKTVSVHELITD